MSDLDEYLLESFSQDAILTTTFKAKADAQVGVCAALCVSFLAVMGETGGIPSLDAVREKFDLSINLQRIIGDAFADVRGSVKKNMNKISHVTRVRLIEVAAGKHVNPLGVQFEALDDGVYFLYVVFTKGAHLIVLFKDKEANSLVLFDPNYGILAGEGTKKVKRLADTLFADYARTGQRLGDWEILRVILAESALDRYKRVARVR